MQVILGIEGIQRYQVLKQPDVLMLLYLLRDRYDLETLRRNWEYYTPRTDLSHGSSLGPPIQALLAARMGDLEEAYRHFLHAALIDLEDLRGNTSDGFHGATAGGLWQALAFGFAGLEVPVAQDLSCAGRSQAEVYTTPRLPAHWQRLAFSVWIRGQRVTVDLRGASSGRT